MVLTASPSLMGSATAMNERAQNWYKTGLWGRRRLNQLQEHPLCKMCLDVGKVVPATVADHIERVDGDYNRFATGKLQSLCVHCHNAKKQRIDHTGYDITVDEKGWPIDPNHPTNKMILEKKLGVGRGGTTQRRGAQKER